MTFLKRLIKNHWPILIIGVLGLTPLWWFRNGLIIAGGDLLEYLDPANNFLNMLSAWYDKFNAGFVNSNIFFVFPFMFFWFVLKSVGVSLVNIERLWTILLFSLSGFSIYWLVTGVFKDKIQNRLMGLIAAIFYMFNPFVVLQVLNMPSRLVQIALPLILLFWIQGLNSSKFSFRYPILIGLVSLFIASANVNLAIVSIIPLTLLFYFIYFVVTHKTRFIHALKLALATVGFYILINLWWLIIVFPNASTLASTVKETVQKAGFIDTTSLTESLRLLGNWALKSFFYQSIPLIPFAHFYYEPLLVPLGFLITILTFSFLWFRLKNREILFFGFLGLIGIFLVKGSNPPFGNFYRFLYEKMPGFWIFRNPYMKFSLLSLFSFSILLGFSVERIYNWFKKGGRFWSNLIPFFVIIALFSISFPILTGTVIQDESWYGLKILSLYAKVPEYWRDISEWFKKNDSDSRVLILPPSGYGQAYNWESGISVSGSPAQFLLPNPLIVYPPDKNNKTDFILNGFFKKIFTDNKLDSLDSLIKLFDIKYIVNQHDLDLRLSLGKFENASAEKIKQVLAQSEEIVFLKSFGKLDLYSIISEKDYSRRFYIPEKISLGVGKTEFLLDSVKSNKTMFFAEDLQEGQVETLLENKAEIVISVQPQNLPKDALEYSFSVSEPASYDIYLKRTGILNENRFDFRGYLIELNGIKKQFSFPEERVKNNIEMKEAKFQDCQFKELQYCANCFKKFKKIFTCDGLKNVIPKDALIKEITLNQELLPLNSDWRRLEIEKELDEKEIRKVKIGLPWSFVQNSGNTDLYESKIPSDFPYLYNTDPKNASPFVISRNGILLEKFWDITLDKFNLVKVSSNPPLLRRIFVSVSKGEKPSGEYDVWYLNDRPGFGNPLKIKFYDDEGNIFLGNLFLKKGEYKLKLPIPPQLIEEFKNFQDANSTEFNLVLKSSDKTFNANSPSFSFEKKSSTNYIVNVKNAREPFFLIFEESYHPAWNAFIGGRKVDPKNHFIAGGYANGWLIEQTGDLKIKVSYSNQKWLYWGWLISGFSLLGGIGYLIKIKKIKSPGEELSPNFQNEETISSFLKLCLIFSRFLFLIFSLIILYLVYLLISGSPAADQTAIYAFAILVFSIILRFFYEWR